MQQELRYDAFRMLYNRGKGSQTISSPLSKPRIVLYLLFSLKALNESEYSSRIHARVFGLMGFLLTKIIP
jgi:hypothetical protein